MNSEPTYAPAAPWLIRISTIFADVVPEIIRLLDTPSHTQLGREYHLVRPAGPPALSQPLVCRFVRWNLPVHHSWPCCPRTMDGFVEKAAQALARKFADSQPQALLVGLLDPGSRDPYYKQLASNLRGRALQLFPALASHQAGAETQDPDAPTLFCLLGREGLFCGVQSPRLSNGFYPGGTRFISRDPTETISRAGAKIAEALHYLRLHRPPPPAKAHWLELGASPGGMTAELLARGYRVTAVDRAPLDPRLAGAQGLRFVCSDAAAYQPEPDARYDAILSDMNGDARDAIRSTLRLTKHLKPSGLVVFVVKTAGVNTAQGMHGLCTAVIGIAAAAGLRVVAQTHLTYNRHEFTLIFEAATAPHSKPRSDTSSSSHPR